MEYGLWTMEYYGVDHGKNNEVSFLHVGARVLRIYTMFATKDMPYDTPYDSISHTTRWNSNILDIISNAGHAHDNHEP